MGNLELVALFLLVYFPRSALLFCCPKSIGSLLGLLHAVYPESKMLPVVQLELL